MKLKSLPFALSSVAALVLIYGCGGSTVVSGDKNPRARAVDLLATPATVSVTIDGIAVAGASTFGSVSVYALYNNGNREVIFKDATTNGTLIDQSPLFELNHFYTCIGYVSAAGPALMVLSDGGNVAADQTQIRFGKAAAGTTASVDVYVTTPGVDLNTVTPTFSGVTLGATNVPYVAFQAGSYEVRETPTGSKVPFDDQTLTFGGGVNTTLLDQGTSTYLALTDQ